MKFLLDIAVILLFTKVFGLICKKFGLPQVIGAILAGIVLGPTLLGWVKVQPGSIDQGLLKDPVKLLSEIGVVLILFSAGLSTDLREMKKTGAASFLITISGVAISLGVGTLITMLIIYGPKYNFQFSNLTHKELFVCFFVGSTMTATSVGIVVEALNELGLLRGKCGASIMGAAVMDDIIGIIVLTIMIGISNPIFNPQLAASSSASIGKIFLNVIYFFIAAIIAGFAIHYTFKFIGRRYNHKRRLPVFSLAICFFFAYMAVKFDMSDVTGAYVAGLFISNLKGSEYVTKRVDTSSYLIFSPIFFATIGIASNLRNLGTNSTFIWFTLAFIVVGLLSKYLSCFVAAKAFNYTNKEASIVGIGMMVRGEVALIVAIKGVDLGIISADYLPSIILLTIVSSILAPILLKMIAKNLERKTKQEIQIDPYLQAYVIQTPKFDINEPLVKGGKLNISLDYSDNIQPKDYSETVEI